MYKGNRKGNREQMKKFLVTDNDLVNFSIKTNVENVNNIFYYYLEPYLYCYELDSDIKEDFIILDNVEGLEGFNIHDNFLYLNNIISFKNGTDIDLGFKRVITSLYTRLLENYNGIFIHGSAISKDEEAIVFIGNRGMGKTFNMIENIIENDYNFVSNDKVFICEKGCDYIVKGVPSSIGLREKNILHFNQLKNFIDQNKVINVNEADNCNEKIYIPIKKFCKVLDSDICNNIKLKEINILYKNNDGVYIKNKINSEDIKPIINEYIIDSVYEEQSFINNMIEVKQNDNFNYENLEVYEVFKPKHKIKNYPKVKRLK